MGINGPDGPRDGRLETPRGENIGKLSGLRVVDMTEAMAGPYCSMLLGDFGADVVKVERPGVGDQSRGWGPPFLDGESAYFLAVNRNKRSVALDIKQPADLEVLHALVDRADVFLTNNPRMRSLAAAGLDPDTARARNPRLVYVAISGYGHTGPKAGRPGYDIIAQGEAGLMALTGAVDGGPSRFPTPMADISAGLFATIGVLASLYARDRRGEDDRGLGAAAEDRGGAAAVRGGAGSGDFLDISLVDAQVTWLANLAGSYFATGERPGRLGNAHPTVTPYQPVRARDKHMIVAVGTERLWERFCAVLDIGDTLRDDPRFKANADRNRNRAELIPLLEHVLGERNADEWVDALVAAGVPAGPINFPDHILEDSHIAARKLIVEIEHPLIGIVRSIGFPAKFASAGMSYRRHPPLLDEHGAEIRAELGPSYAPPGQRSQTPSR